MTQSSESKIYEIEIKENKEKATLIIIEKEPDNSNGISNPRYFEKARTPKKAKASLPLKMQSYYKGQF
ncbi:MAG: hypothetical protein ACXABG_00840 [Promethearchaeota archaeon]|jgi:hypothetical protein